jgi:hypothetical protein
MGAILSFIPTLLGILGELPKVLAAFDFLRKAITDVEASGKSGPDKLTAVLNDFEVFLKTAAPNYAQPFETIAADVEAVVNEIVAIYNEFAKPKTA